MFWVSDAMHKADHQDAVSDICSSYCGYCTAHDGWKRLTLPVLPGGRAFVLFPLGLKQGPL